MPWARSLPAMCLLVWAAAGCSVNRRAEPMHATAPPRGRVPETKTSAQGTPYSFHNATILGGGFVTGIEFSRARRGLAYARSDAGGVFRYEPGLGRWVPLLDQLGRSEACFLSVESVAPDPRDANTLYVAAGAYSASWANNAVILRSNDQGLRWQRTELPLRLGASEPGRALGERLVVDPNRTDSLLLGTRSDGLWRSRDAGVTWTRVEAFPLRDDGTKLGISFVLFDAASGQLGTPTPTLFVGVAGAGRGLYVSHDAGESFTRLPNQPPGLIPAHAGLDAERTLYVAYTNAPGPQAVSGGALYAFARDGARAADISPLIPNSADAFGYGGLAVDARRAGSLLVTSIGRARRGDAIWRSVDGGKHWVSLLPKATRERAGAEYLLFGGEKLGIPSWMADIEIDPFDSEHVLHVSGQGVWESSDVAASERDLPTHWSFQNRGLELTGVTALLAPASGPELLSGVADLCGFRHDQLDVSPQRGAFTAPRCNTTTSLDYAAQHPRWIARVGNRWGAGEHGAFSTDLGRNWSAFASEPRGAESGGVIALSADGETLLWALANGVPAYSRNRGRHWHEISGLPTPQQSESALLTLRLAADRVSPERAYAFDLEHSVLYASRDGGRSFERANAALPPLSESARASASVQALPGAEGDVWVSTGRQLFRSTDAGVSFAPLAAVEESHALGFGRAAPDRANPSIFLAGRVSGVNGLFRSDDLGASWVRINDDAHQFGFVSALAGDPRRFGRVYVGTLGRGILIGDPSIAGPR